MSKRALLISVVTAMAVITAGCDEELPPVDADSGMMQDGGSTGDVDAGMTGDVDSGMTGDEDGGTGDEDGGTGDEDGGTGDEDGGMTGDVCGDGVVTGDETCDSAIEAGMPGACPASCNDGLACTTDTLVGAAATCDAECTTTDITTCTAGDGCCPSGCTTDDDDDCACTPRTTCTVDECGMVDDGCGNPLDCGACGTGGACATDADCAGDNVCATEEFGWTDGYCTIGCYDDSYCDTGAHCVGGDAASTTVGQCMPDCTTNSDCRTSGYSCQDWDGDTTLECAPSATGTGAPGAACTGYADCAGGDDGFCLAEASGWQDGYCSVECATNADCAGTSHCGVIDGTTGLGACLSGCTADADCRTPGYGCMDVDMDGTGECWPAATGTGATGSACEHVFECAGGNAGACFSGVALTADGYCSAGCAVDADCTAGGHCSAAPVNGQGIVGICTATCTSDADCRTGHTCHDVDGNGSSECWAPPATGAGTVGAACTDNSDCAGGTEGYCDTEFTGGYCTQHCGPGLACPTGSACMQLGTDIFCMDECSGSGMGDCRSGQTCFPVDASLSICA